MVYVREGSMGWVATCDRCTWSWRRGDEVLVRNAAAGHTCAPSTGIPERGAGLTEREKAIRQVLFVIGSPVARFTRPEREDAYRLAREHALSATDLLDYLSSRGT